jgi:hypothetical protein
MTPDAYPSRMAFILAETLFKNKMGKAPSPVAIAEINIPQNASCIISPVLSWLFFNKIIFYSPWRQVIHLGMIEKSAGEKAYLVNIRLL